MLPTMFPIRRNRQGCSRPCPRFSSRSGLGTPWGVPTHVPDASPRYPGASPHATGSGSTSLIGGIRGRRRSERVAALCCAVPLATESALHATSRSRSGLVSPSGEHLFDAVGEILDQSVDKALRPAVDVEPTCLTHGIYLVEPGLQRGSIRSVGVDDCEDVPLSHIVGNAKHRCAFGASADGIDTSEMDAEPVPVRGAVVRPPKGARLRHVRLRAYDTFREPLIKELRCRFIHRMENATANHLDLGVRPSAMSKEEPP